jgi:hypothetical protein
MAKVRTTRKMSDEVKPPVDNENLPDPETLQPAKEQEVKKEDVVAARETSPVVAKVAPQFKPEDWIPSLEEATGENLVTKSGVKVAEDGREYIFVVTDHAHKYLLHSDGSYALNNPMVLHYCTFNTSEPKE